MQDSPTTIWDVISRREARVGFWLVVVALVAAIYALTGEALALLAWPVVILFVAWLTSYVLEPPISWLQRHMPPHSRGLSAAITYVVFIVAAVVVVLAAGAAIFNAAVYLVDNLPSILERVGEVLRPIFERLGITLPSGGDPAAAIMAFLEEYGSQIGDAVAAAARNLVAVVGALFTAIVISVGLAAGQVTLLGWLHPFLPRSTYRDLTGLERAIAVSFGGFVRGRLLIGVIFGLIIWVTAFLLGIPMGALIAVIAGVIIFIPWIGPLFAWAVLPAFALVLAPDAVGPALVISLAAAVLIQVLVTQLVMGAAVKMKPVAVFAVVIVGTSIAGILGAIFAIPTAAAILAVAEYLRQRDVLLRASAGGEGEGSAGEEKPPEPTTGHAGEPVTPEPAAG
jgi:predicted PurR-regulated permease PerM